MSDGDIWGCRIRLFTTVPSVAPKSYKNNFTWSSDVKCSHWITAQVLWKHDSQHSRLYITCEYDRIVPEHSWRLGVASPLASNVYASAQDTSSCSRVMHDCFHLDIDQQLSCARTLDKNNLKQRTNGSTNDLDMAFSRGRPVACMLRSPYRHSLAAAIMHTLNGLATANRTHARIALSAAIGVKRFRKHLRLKAAGTFEIFPNNFEIVWLITNSHHPV